MQFVRWLDSGLDDEPGTPGFQPAGGLFAPISNSEGEYYASIQAAIDGTNAGGQVDVSDGTFSENVTIDKALTLSGAKAGQTGYTELLASGVARESSGESEIIGQVSSSLIATVTVTADDVTIDGFKIDLPATSGADITGVYADKASGISGVTVENNVIDGLTAVGAVSSNGIFVGGHAATSSTVTGNYIANVATGPGITSGGDAVGAFSIDFAITDNIVANSQYGISGYLGDGSAIQGNIILGGANSAFGIAGQFNSLDITGNTVTGIAYPGGAAIAIANLTGLPRTQGDVYLLGNVLANNTNQLALAADLMVRTSAQTTAAPVDTASLAQIVADNDLDRDVYITQSDGALRPRISASALWLCGALFKTRLTPLRPATSSMWGRERLRQLMALWRSSTNP